MTTTSARSGGGLLAAMAAPREVVRDRQPHHAAADDRDLGPGGERSGAGERGRQPDLAGGVGAGLVLLVVDGLHPLAALVVEPVGARIARERARNR